MKEEHIMEEEQLNNAETEETNHDEIQADTPNRKGLAALWQFIKFGLVGVSNTAVSYITYTIVYYGLKGHFEDVAIHLGNILGFILSVLNAFFWQSKFVFKEEEGREHRVWWQVLLKTYASYAFTGLFLTEVLLYLWLNVLDISRYLEPLVVWLSGFGPNMQAKDLAVLLAPFLNMVITIPINFIINKFWAYRQGRKKTADGEE